MTRTIAKHKVETVRLSQRKCGAKARLQEHESAERHDIGDERARERKIQLSPKDILCRAGRHGPKDCAPYSGRSPIVTNRRSQQRP